MQNRHIPKGFKTQMYFDKTFKNEMTKCLIMIFHIVVNLQSSVQCTIYETCAILHRFHIMLISRGLTPIKILCYSQGSDILYIRLALDIFEKKILY